jgi:transcriptional regulator with XRE-family HTH domain
MGTPSAWSDLLRAHIRRQGLTADRFAELNNVTQSSISDYCRGNLKPPLAKISDFADVLELRGPERQTFVEEAYLAHTPDNVLHIIKALRSEVAHLKRLCAQRHMDLRDVGCKQSQL